MSYKHFALLACFFVLPCSLRAGIELLSLKEDPSRGSTAIRLGLTTAQDNVQAELAFTYPGSVKPTARNGKETAMLSNNVGSIVALNFRAGTQATDCVAVAVSPDSRFVYFGDLNHTIALLIQKWREMVDEASLRIVDVKDEAIILESYQHGSAGGGTNFRVVAHVLQNGDLRIEPQDITDIPP